MGQPIEGFWTGRRVLVTGHTGFKGSWLTAWLHRQGATVTGYGLPPVTDPSLFAAGRIAELCDHVEGDVRDAGRLAGVVAAARPEVAFHLAAQPLVLESLRDPVGTFTTNVMGTVNLLEAARGCGTLRALVMVTSDKCYRDIESLCAEDDPLGGVEPYSASKACAEIVVGAWRSCFLGTDRCVGVATARAGNVIGAGDFSADRLIPDLVRAVRGGRPAILRHPQATRPWQHVFDALSGYLTLAEALCRAPEAHGTSWNFGPSHDETWTVAEIADAALRRLGYGSWQPAGEPTRHEAPVLRLSAIRARRLLGWRPRLDTAAAIDWTIDGYRDLHEHGGRGWLELQLERYAELTPALPHAAAVMALGAASAADA